MASFFLIIYSFKKELRGRGHLDGPVFGSQALGRVMGLGKVVRNTQGLNWAKVRKTINSEKINSFTGNCGSFLSFFLCPANMTKSSS